MKNFIKIFLGIIMVASLCSCTIGDFGIKSDQDIANEQLEQVLEAIEEKDKEKLKSLFSTFMIRNVENFDEKIDELFEIYDGELVSYYDWGGVGETTNRENDEIFQEVESTYDVKTTEDEYRIAIKTIKKDTEIPNNEGIYSLYIIRAEDDPNPDFAYYGDGEYNPGINIESAD